MKELASRPGLRLACPHLPAYWKLFCHLDSTVQKFGQCDEEEKHITSISDMDHQRLDALSSACAQPTGSLVTLVSKVQHARIQSQKPSGKWGGAFCRWQGHPPVILLCLEVDTGIACSRFVDGMCAGIVAIVRLRTYN